MAWTSRELCTLRDVTHCSRACSWHVPLNKHSIWIQYMEDTCYEKVPQMKINETCHAIVVYVIWRFRTTSSAPARNEVQGPPRSSHNFSWPTFSSSFQRHINQPSTTYSFLFDPQFFSAVFRPKFFQKINFFLTTTIDRATPKTYYRWFSEFCNTKRARQKFFIKWAAQDANVKNNKIIFKKNIFSANAER